MNDIQLNLTRDLVFFDVETTGLNVIRDRILQIALVKLHKNGQEPSELSMLINPGIPIAEEAMAVHGITPKDLANKPVFAQVAQKIWDFIGDADIAGYNSNRFDVPMLMEEFARVGMEFDISKRRLIDVQRIFYKMEPRTLKAAYRFYCQKELEDAHDALADVRAAGTITATLDNRQRYDELEREYERVQAALQKLTYFDDLSGAQAAQVLGVSVGTIKSTLSRALAKLRTSPLLDGSER